MLNSFTNTTVEAYALPGSDDAYTVHVDSAKPDGLTAYGRVSAWLSLAFPAMLVGALVVVRVNRSRRRR